MKFIIPTLLFSFSSLASFVYPEAKKIPLVETRFGEIIEDPYKWMENPSDPDLWSWIEEQKTVTADYLDPNQMDAFAQKTLDYRKLRLEQPKLPEEVKASSQMPVIPKSLEDHLNMGQKVERLIVWESKSIHVLKSNDVKTESSLYQIESKAVASGDLMRVIVTQKSDNKLVDILLVKFYTFITWADDKSFYYVSDMDERQGGGRPALFKHTVGDVQSEDKLLFTGKNASSYLTIHQVGSNFFAEVDGTIGTLQLSSGKVTNRLEINGEIISMNDAQELEAIILTFANANRGEFHLLRLRDGERQVLVKEQDFVLEKIHRLDDNSMFIVGLKDGSHVAGIFNINSGLKMIDLKDGSLAYLSDKDGALRISYESYATPRKAFSYNLKTNELTQIWAHSYPIEIESEKISYTASNGEEASIWVMKKKGVKLTEKTPLILYGYGGFRVSITPSFGIYENLAWIDKGGVFAVATLPGSLDYGESWYQIARVGGRIHSWDSFALAAKELFKRGYTSKEHIGMMGASNGGTLTAGTLQRHSDTFKAAVPIVGVMDLLNYTLFTAGKYWTDDYGNPFIENDFRAMFGLSPYHNLEKRDYPATMVMTAEFDDRVVPMHSYKYLARLQEYNTSDAPTLLYNKEWGGHGRASGSARESSRFVAAFYTFFAQQLGL